MGEERGQSKTERLRQTTLACAHESSRRVASQSEVIRAIVSSSSPHLRVRADVQPAGHTHLQALVHEYAEGPEVCALVVAVVSEHLRRDVFRRPTAGVCDCSKTTAA